MIKKIIMTFVCFYTLSCFAVKIICPQAVSTSSPVFCSSFKAVAECHCSNSLPKSMCTDMQQLYKRMIGMFGSIEKACQFQRDTSTQNCVDDWNCYRSGGKNSRGELCSGTGAACS